MTVREVVSTGRLAPGGHLGAAAPRRPRGGDARDRDGRARRPGRRAAADALRRDAAARADREGARLRADAARARRADDGRRRRVAGVARRSCSRSCGRSSASRSSTSRTSSARSSTSSTGSCSSAAASSTTGRRAGFPACGTTRLDHQSMLDLEFMRLALATGAIVGLLAPAVGFFLVERKASLIGDGLGHVAFAGVALGLPARHLAGADGARRRGGRRAHDRVAAHPRRRGRRPGARARLLHRHRRRRRARLARGRAQRQPLPVPVRLDPHRHARRPLDGARARGRRARDDRGRSSAASSRPCSTRRAAASPACR